MLSRASPRTVTAATANAGWMRGRSLLSCGPLDRDTTDAVSCGYGHTDAASTVAAAPRSRRAPTFQVHAVAVRDMAVSDSDFELVRIERTDHRADVVIDRPQKRNAMNPQVIAELTEAFERVSGTDGVRAVTLLGAGDVFCAGMDLEMMRERVEADSDAEHAFPDLLSAVEDCAQPVVAGIKRAGPAGAFELTLPCDLRVLGEAAKYGVIEVKLGTFPHGGATQRLPRLVGLSKAKEIVLTGEFIDPAEAHDIGLVHEVCPDGEVDARARALADDLCENAPLGLRNAKRALDAALETPLDEGLAMERSLGRELDDTADYREGFDARLEGREPEFRGE